MLCSFPKCHKSFLKENFCPQKKTFFGKPHCRHPFTKLFSGAKMFDGRPAGVKIIYVKYTIQGDI
jgi:hypothetical protein